MWFFIMEWYLIEILNKHYNIRLYIQLHHLQMLRRSMKCLHNFISFYKINIILKKPKNFISFIYWDGNNIVDNLINNVFMIFNALHNILIKMIYKKHLMILNIDIYKEK